MPKIQRRASSRTGMVAPGPIAILRSQGGVAVPLRGVSARGRLEGLIFELTVEQRYQNTSTDNLEAVFTFPLPLRAVLLGFDLEIGERKLSAVAVARQEASERYERAIDEGNTAALIEHDGNGLYTVSLGNLMTGEHAVIRYRYAELLDAHDGYVRLNVPTVIAPRYGNPKDAGLEGPSVPGVDLLGEYPFEIRLDLINLTNASAVRSPSHKVRAEAGEEGLTVTLARAGFLDRDFVLELDQAAIPTNALVARDGDGYVMLASSTLALDKTEQRPLTLKVLLDCSGSMGGDSIVSAKRALLTILERLTPTDQVSLTRFGSSHQHVTEGLEPADAHTLIPLKAVVRTFDADLGGTEMKGALRATLGIPVATGQQADLILITDGEIYDIERVVDLAAKSGHRLFAIAIGAAPVEALARLLADKTGGACGFVGPGEDAEAAILRTFKRLRSNPRTVGAVKWPLSPDWTAPQPSAVFPGDTLHVLAGFSTEPTGAVEISIRDAEGQRTTIHLQVTPHVTDGDLLPRLAAARRIGTLDEAEACDLAVTYQLATEHTSFVVVAERAEGEKAEGLPATVVVPHMLAAGWGASARTRDLRCLALAVPNTPEDRQSQLKLLIARGKEQGFLTYAEVNDHLPSEIVDPEQIEDIVQMINDMGIPVYEKAPDAESLLMLEPVVADEDQAFHGEMDMEMNDVSMDISVRERANDSASDESTEQRVARTFSDVEALLIALATSIERGEPAPTTLADLAARYPLPDRLRARLESLIEAEVWHREEIVIAVFIALLADRVQSSELDDREGAALKGAWLSDRMYRELRRRILEHVLS